MNDLEFVLADIKAKSPKDYILILLAPAENQRALIAFCGLDLLLQQAMQQTREPAMLGVRLQYFKDQISAIYKGASYDAVPSLRLIANLIKEVDIEITYWHDYIQTLLQSQNINTIEIPQKWEDSLSLLRLHRDTRLSLIAACIEDGGVLSQELLSYYAWADYIDWLDFDLRYNRSKLPQSVRDDCQMSGNLYALQKSNIPAFSKLYLQQLDMFWGRLEGNLSELSPALKILILQGRCRHVHLKRAKNLTPVMPGSISEWMRVLWWRFKY